MSDAIPLPPDASGRTESGVHTDADFLREEVKLAYANLPVSQAVALANGLVLAIVLSFAMDVAPITGWLALLVVVTLARMFLGSLFRRAPSGAENWFAWRASFMLGALTSGLVWGSTAFWLYPPDSVVHQVFIAFVVGGMVIGAVAALSPMFPAFLLFAACALLPHILRYLLEADYVHFAMAAMGAIFLAAMIVLGKRNHRTMTELLKLRFENRDLITYLTGSRKDLVAANADLLAVQATLTRTNEVLESRVAERTAALQAADRRKDEFLAVLSHELRNPLAPIRNSIYMLNHCDPAGSQAQRAREIIERQTQHITRLVDDLLDVSRIARGKIELRRERTDLTELVRRTVQDYASVFQQYGITLEVILPQRPVWANIDATRIAQLVGNLLQNAAKFTPAAGRVDLSLQIRGGWGEIRVADTGAGIAPELLPELFEPFMQGKQSLARTEGGLGLGLALVKGIVEMHAGSVRVESEGIGKGAAFTARLPLLSMPVEQAAPVAAAPAKSGLRRVLVVDDNSDAADSLAQLVTLFGHSAEVAYDGTSAVEKARAHPPDVLLCDLGLPGMTGYEVARVLRVEHGGTRLIAVSGYAQSEDIARAKEAGFERHIAKPLDPETVRSLLQS